MGRRNAVAGQETELHQPPRVSLRKVQSGQNSGFAALQMCQIPVDTRLHLFLSILFPLKKVKLPITTGLHLEYTSKRTDSVLFITSTSWGIMEAMQIALPPPVETIVRELHAAGHRAVVVGGAVRDALLGLDPKDIDVEVYGIAYDRLAALL